MKKLTKDFNLEARIKGDIDTCLHPERNGLLMKEQVAEGASHEFLIKRELRTAIRSLVADAIEACIGEEMSDLRIPRMGIGMPQSYVDGFNTALEDVRNRKEELLK